MSTRDHIAAEQFTEEEKPLDGITYREVLEEHRNPFLLPEPKKQEPSKLQEQIAAAQQKKENLLKALKAKEEALKSKIVDGLSPLNGVADKLKGKSSKFKGFKKVKEDVSAYVGKVKSAAQAKLSRSKSAGADSGATGAASSGDSGAPAADQAGGDSGGTE